MRKTKRRDNAAMPVPEWESMPTAVREGIEALRDKKVDDIRVYDLREFTPFCDYVILGTVFSSAQAKAARARITDAIEEQDLKLYGVEGDDESSWLLIDFWDIVVHLFRPDTRHYYSLETLWADLPWWPGEIEV